MCETTQVAQRQRQQPACPHRRRHRRHQSHCQHGEGNPADQSNRRIVELLRIAGVGGLELPGDAVEPIADADVAGW